MQPSYHTLECVQGDLTEQRVDAIVNAASRELRGGGGVDGAIHRAAGPELLEELRARYPAGCETGEVRPTAGHRLAARHVFHAVGPIYRDGRSGESEALAACHASALALCAEHDVRTLAFPAISCGVYGYPWEAAAEIALRTTARELLQYPSLERVRFVLFGSELLTVFQRTLARLRSEA